MCGICASVSSENQINNILKGLKQLEYRGYDSCGISYLENGKIKTIKAIGQIENLRKKAESKQSSIVIGHTRWATHGVVNEKNAHPHTSFDNKVSLVHNGIIENYKEIKQKYLNNIKFSSQTDTEVIANLIAVQSGENIQKIASACKILRGSYAIAVLFEGDERIYVAKNESPLYIATNKKTSMTTSDVSVFCDDFNDFFTLGNDEIAIISKELVFFDLNLNRIKKNSQKIIKNDILNEKANSKNQMFNEILQQPNCLKNSYFKYFRENIISEKLIIELKKTKNIYFIACGSAYHSALLGAKYMERYAKKVCKTAIASEFRYSSEKIKKNTLYVFVSQSGETADTLACVKKVKKHHGKTLAVSNVSYCTLNSLTDYVLPTFAGREFAVASTKAYTCQVFAFLCVSCILANKSFEKEIKFFVDNFCVESKQLGFSNVVLKYSKIFFIGREEDYVTCLEASLKLKEISYINCVGMPAGELKHGSLALIDKNSLVVVVSTRRFLKEKIENNIQEIKARGGDVFLISNFKHDVAVDYQKKLCDFDEKFMPIVSVVEMQKLAFEVCLKKGYDPDKPRNLAKAVTVE